MPSLMELLNSVPPATQPSSLAELLSARPSMPPAFDPFGNGYDYHTATQAGMRPDGTGVNAGHWGSVAPAPEPFRQIYGLPREAYLMLKGRDHKTWGLGVEGEQKRGFKVIRLGDRYFSVPADWVPPK